MGDHSKDDGQLVPWARTIGRGSGGVEGAGLPEAVSSGLATRANPAGIRQGFDRDRRGGGSWDVRARGEKGRSSVSGWRAFAGPGRGGAAQAGTEARCPQGGGHRCDGLRSPTTWSLPMVHGADCRGGCQAKDSRQGRPRDDSPDAETPRAKAVAGKKCGASRRWMRST